ncbi:hypothetical protein FGE12_08525 [Aggregicoccus sp. 17bor-14]|uniref:hypothetical protein n=1 Tax=Myxococcaceae TaxID=31 RepID=UPI00129C71F7|nr:MULTISPECIES: hypothetical protein [Myxococcaceae]MBF5042443.1 hypothetical protein [Simulacricoccus sp. 17bor-14]MRI88214.1 hypothetical protein [Aggregicoccus sp. 17bor-14]
MSTYKDLLFLQGYMGAASVEAERETGALEAPASAAKVRRLEAVPQPRRLTLVRTSVDAREAGGCC